MVEKHFKVMAHTGFAIPATMLVTNTSLFKSRVILEYKGETIELENSPKSIMDIMLLNIRPEDHFTIRTDGIDAYDSLKSIEISLSNLELQCL